MSQKIEDNDQLMASMHTVKSSQKSELKETIKTYKLKFQQKHPSQHENEYYLNVLAV